MSQSLPPNFLNVSARFAGARRVLALAVGAGLLIGAAGCSPTTPDQVTPEAWVEPPTIAESATALFSAEQIDAAYSTVTAFALDHGFNAELTDPQVTTFTAEQLVEPVLPAYSPALQERWRAYAEAAVGASAASNPDAAQAAKDDMRILQFFDWEQPTWSLPADGTALQWQWLGNGQIEGEPAVVPAPSADESVEEVPVEEAPVEDAPVEEAPVEDVTVDEEPVEVDGQASLDEEGDTAPEILATDSRIASQTVPDTTGPEATAPATTAPQEAVPARLKVTLDQEVEFVFIEDGGEFKLPLTKRVTYWLVPNAAGDGWLIDAYEGAFGTMESLPTDQGGQQDLPASTSNPFNSEPPQDTATPAP